MDSQLPPTRKDRMMRRDIFSQQELQLSFDKQFIVTRFGQRPSWSTGPANCVAMLQLVL
jgi:hypothetical protein